MENLIEVKNLYKTYQENRGFLSPKTEPTKALEGINLEIKKGEILALVGESGCGKSTLGNCILKLIETTSGEILFKGENILKFDKKQTKEFRKKAQMIFQNPYSSLNPKMKIGEILEEPLIINGFKDRKKRKQDVIESAQLCGLSEGDLKKYPHEFSGGQRQRVAIARALVLKPEFIVADEPISALDVSIAAQIINLLCELKDKLNLTFLFISHDLNIVRYISQRVAILNKGKIVEIGETQEVFDNPKDNYTKLLISSIPKINI